MRRFILAGVLAAASLAGCAGTGLSQRESRILGGAAIGGVAGNVLGHSTAATVGGAAIGGLIGNEVDRRDRERRYDPGRRYNGR